MSISSSIVTSAVTSCSFGFYSEEEIKHLSVKRITRPEGLDALGQPISGGLYDPALGPLDRMASCVTCKLPFESCPGHMGRFELAVPVYHPLLFQYLLKLLRKKCLHCHRFRFREHALNQFVRKLQLIENGLILEANKINSSSAGKSAGVAADDDELMRDVDDYDDVSDDVLAGILKRAKHERSSASDMRAHRRLTVRDFYRWVPPKKCSHCGLTSPNLRSEGCQKIFIQGERRTASADISQLLGILDDDVSAGYAKSGMKVMLPNETLKHMELLFDREESVMHLLLSCESVCGDVGRASSFGAASYSMFFVKVLAVTPSRYRPPAQMGDVVADSPQNTLLRKIVMANNAYADMSFRMHGQRQQHPDADDDDDDDEAADADAPGRKKKRRKTKQKQKKQKLYKFADLFAQWIEIQDNVSLLMDNTKSSKPSYSQPSVQGARQRIEKKQGLFRMNMMGKRVNFSARSVISPDVNLHTREIGVPDLFARQLTYPEPVTHYNYEQMRQAVINGAKKHPGANYVVDEFGRKINLLFQSDVQREALANRLLSGSQTSSENATARSSASVCTRKVFRHLRDGDVLLVNRQPTLHKASLMAHKARVLTNQKTIRMHYANCNTYNADFDGDEINLHFPQSELARAEAYELANTDNQYLTVKDGSPLRGLIQDHVGAGVLLTKRDAFFTREQYHQLLYAACVDVAPQTPLPLQTPAIMRPRPLWSGKQIISSILSVICAGKVPLNMDGKSRIPADTWSGASGTVCRESTVVIRDGHLLVGVLDKNQFGASKFGLVHCCYELYGPDAAGDLLSALGRLFSAYIQRQRSFTCGIDDLRLQGSVERQRRTIIDGSRRVGVEATAAFTKTELGDDHDDHDEAEEEALVCASLRQSLLRSSGGGEALLDSAVKSQLNGITSRVIAISLPLGQEKAFPRNNLSLMTLSGAKGSKVNFSQISCLLGQQELEGRRVPRMCSGRTLPSFKAFSPEARAGGFITDRFLTGVRPQEYYFHCMAGREGLVDTAVKTSRSGYLQRCLVKHLESLSVAYDYTVRDADGSVIMFNYGEDSIDVGKSLPLSNPLFMARNFHAMLERLQTRAALPRLDPDKAIDAWEHLETVAKTVGGKGDGKGNGVMPDPLLSRLWPGRDLGCVSEKVQDIVSEFAHRINDFSSSASHPPLTADKFQMGIWLKYMESLVAPGENVGVLTAQSLGEPSTQMTLNTFHLAGFGGANVTLGIPRLVEIIMSASRNQKTPLMEVFLRDDLGNDRKSAERLAHKLRCIRLAEIVERVQCRESIGRAADGEKMRLYTLHIDFRDLHEYDLNLDELRTCVQNKFLPRMIKLLSKSPGIKIVSRNQAPATQTKNLHDHDDHEDDEDDEKEQDEKAEKKDDEDDEDDDEVVSDDDEDNDEEEVEEEEDDDDDDDEKKEKTKKKKKDDEDENLVWQDSDNDDEDNDDDDDDDDDDDAMEKLEPTNAKRSSTPLQHHSRWIKSVSFGSSSRAPFVEVVVQMPLASRRLLMLSLVESAQEKVLLRHTKGISKCYVIEKRKDERDVNVVQTDGVNFQSIWEHLDVVDVNELRSNDIGALLDTYGVEAARAAIVNEISSVFGVYGICVDYRHLYLLADYMTFNGDYRPLNRTGLEFNASPWQKMTFEQSSKFLLESCMFGDPDELISPSSRIVLGQTVHSGTGAFDLVQPIKL